MPGLGTLNGVGAGLYGSRNAAPDGTYVATHCFCILFIPLIPFSSYLVRREGRGWRFYGKVPLSNFARRARVAVLLAAVGLPLGSWGVAELDRAPFVQEP